MKSNSDFVFDLSRAEACRCDANESESSLKIYDSDGTSSSENEDDYFASILPEVTEEELKGLTLQLENPLKCLRPILEFLDPRMYEKIISYVDPKHFFVEPKEKKINFLNSGPNSYFPLLKKPSDSKDVICAPSYLTEKEEEFFVRPFFIDTSKITITNRGMTLKFDLKDRTDEQSNYVFNQGKFYEGLVKDRLVNGKKAENEEQDYDLPVSVYEPVTFLKRFCEVFYYLNISFLEICGKNLTEDVIIKKFSTGLISGFHKVLGSQGLPLPVLIGETYQITDVTGNFELFAEVKNNKPVKICYNIRWKKREALIDGTVEFGFEFDEDKDQFNINLTGTNKLRVLVNENTYSTFYFNFPLSLSFHNIVDQTEFRNERSMTVNGIMYVKGDIFCSLFNFNFLDSIDFSLKLVGFIKKGINRNTLTNGHSFIGLIFHSSSFSFPSSIKNYEILNELFVKKKTNTKKSINLEKKGERNSFDLSGNKKDLENSNLPQGDKSLDKSPERTYININRPTNLRKSEIKKTVRINQNPNSYLNQIFAKVVDVTNTLIKKSEFVNSFSEGFVDKIFLGSWTKMNFYEVNLNNNDELSEYYLKFDRESMKAKSHSIYNKKAAIFMPWENYDFYKTLKSNYKEDNWAYVKSPLPCDTRFREDFLWLLRYYQIIGRTAGYQEKSQEELNNLRLEAIINAGKWKDLLDLYVYRNISKVINQPKVRSPSKKNNL